MRFLKFLLVATLVSCGVIATQAEQHEQPWKNGKLKVSGNQRFLQHENGAPFFWLGDTDWLLPQHLNREEVAYFFDRARRAGYNVAQVQVQSMDNFPCYNVYGQASIPDNWDMNKADPDGVYSFWDHLDYIVKTAEQNGIYVGLVCVWGYYVKNGKIGVEEAKRYGTFLANRYKDAPNIIWFMGGDIQGDIHPEMWDALATTIKSIDNNHMMTYHPRGRYTSAQFFPKAKWLDLHTFQSGHRRYGQRMGNAIYPIKDDTEEDNWMYVDSTWTHDPTKPVLDSEPSYENIPIGLHDPDEARWQDYDVRRYAYWSVFAGSCGHTYGHNSLQQMLKPGYHTGYGRDGDEPAWYEAQNAPGYNQMKFLKNLMLSLPYFVRVPDQSVIVGKNGTKYNRLLATRGNDYLLVYNYNSVPMKLDLGKISGSKKNAWWMDAATGTLEYIGEFDDKVITFAPQKRNRGICDGVFIAIDASKGYFTKEQTVIDDQSVAGRARDLNE